MRWFVRLAVKLALIWCCGWVLVAVGIHIAVPRLLQAQGDSLEATFDGVGGFPSHFGLNFSNIILSDPGGASAWAAPEILISLRAWNPAHIQASFPREHSLRLGSERIDIAAQESDVEIALRPTPALTFSGFSSHFSEANLNSNQGGAVGVALADIDIWRASEPQAYDIDVMIKDLVLPADIRREVDLSGQLPDLISRFSIEALVAFDAPWNRYTLDGPYPQPTKIDLRAVSLNWGELQLSAKGVLDIDELGQGAGVILVGSDNWRKLLDFLVVNGSVPVEDRNIWENTMSVLSGGGDALELPLVFSQGVIALGPIPLGPAPVLRIPDKETRSF